MTTKKKKPLNRQEKKLKKILQQISGDFDNLDGELLPELLIRGKGYMYCFDPMSRELVRVTRGLGAYVIEELKNGKSLIYTTSGLIVEIEADELVLIGFD
jgi:hypothetical protein|tara:strand:+ start:114 stop:413 length:300 start_codon:yes stop_codon:yes gene_type:complete